MFNPDQKIRLTFITLVIMNTLQSCTSWAPKRTREDLNYLYSPPEYSFTPETEPTCDELRAIWRMTKRAAQQSILTNQVTDPAVNFGYMVKSPSILDVKPARVAKTRPKHSYGKVLVQPSQVKSGAFDEVKETLKNAPARNPGPVVYAPLDPDYDYSAPVKEFGDKSIITGWEDTIHQQRHPQTTYGTYEMAPSDERQSDLNLCQDITAKKCRSNVDCDCFGLFVCVLGQCRRKTINGKVNFNDWEDNNSNYNWYKNHHPLLPTDVLSNQKSKDGRRKSLRRTDRKKVGLFPNYYSQHNFNKWT